MEIALWLILLAACIAGTSIASRRAVTAALRVTDSTSWSPAFIGLTIMAIGTDLPEIANSLVSSATDHGDVNVGDSMGSVVTQITLVLGLLCLFGRNISASRNFVVSVGLATFFASVVVWMLLQDGDLDRFDGLTLILLWLVGTLLLSNTDRGPRQLRTATGAKILPDVGKTMAWLLLVGILAIGVVQAFLHLAEEFGVPEFIGSFVALSIGTSLPELVVDWTAIRRGASAMAIGDVFGSSFVDATLSIGSGPAIFGSVVSVDVRSGVLFAAAGVVVATVLVARARNYDWKLAVPLLTLYVAVQLGVGFIKI